MHHNNKWQKRKQWRHWTSSWE